MFRSITLLIAVLDMSGQAALAAPCSDYLQQTYGKGGDYFTGYAVRRAVRLGWALAEADQDSAAQLVADNLTGLEQSQLHGYLSKLAGHLEGCELALEVSGDPVDLSLQQSPFGEVMVALDRQPRFIVDQEAKISVLSDEGDILSVYTDPSLAVVGQVIETNKQRFAETQETLNQSMERQQDRLAEIQEKVAQQSAKVEEQVQAMIDEATKNGEALLDSEVMPLVERTIQDSKSIVKQVCGLDPQSGETSEDLIDGCLTLTLNFAQQQLLDSGLAEEGAALTDDVGRIVTDAAKDLATQAISDALNSWFGSAN